MAASKQIEVLSSDGVPFPLDIDRFPTLKRMVKSVDSQVERPLVPITSNTLKDLQKFLYTGVASGDIRELQLAMDFFELGSPVTDVPEQWHRIKLEEDWFRRNVTSKRLDPHHGLVEVTDELLTELFVPHNRTSAPAEVLFSGPVSVSRDDQRLIRWIPRTPLKKAAPKQAPTSSRSRSRSSPAVRVLGPTTPVHPRVIAQPVGQSDSNSASSITPKRPSVQQVVALLKKRIGVPPNSVLAGGSLVCLLMGIETRFDLDFFVDGVESREDALDVTRAILAPPRGDTNCYTIHRNPMVITKKGARRGEYEKQVILRIYSSMAEVLHGFDLDSCKVGFDGQKLWMTRSCVWSWKNRLNVVDFDRMSPSYEYRLAKYAQRGFDVWVPNFDISRARSQTLADVEERQLFGLSRLLALCHLGELRPREGDSDYDPLWAVKHSQAEEAKAGYPNGYPHHRSRRRVIRGATDVVDLGKRLHRNKENAVVAMQVVQPEAYETAQRRSYRQRPLSAALYNEEEDEFEEMTLAYQMFDPIHALVIDEDVPDEELGMTREIEFMTLNPGQQSTGTFHPMVLKDRTTWYEGPLYRAS